MSEAVYIVAGEVSGDVHGAGLIRALRARRPGVETRGWGGPELARASGGGVRDWVDEAAVVGVWEVLKKYGWFRERFDATLAAVREWRPRVLLLVDYPGFNLRLAEAVRACAPETRIVYYISPQVWAWHKERLPKMARLLDEMLCILPFEAPIFEAAGLRTRFVGHPLVDELAGEAEAAAREAALVGLFPGSREREVGRLFPMMLETARRMAARREGLRFEAPAASGKLAEEMRGMVAAAGCGGMVEVTDGGSHALMRRAACGVIASGTATLEAACLGLPYCLVYKVAWPTYLLGRMLVKLPHIGLVNILAGTQVVEEFIQRDAEPGRVGAALERFLGDEAHRATAVRRLEETAALLGGPGAHERAAAAVAEWLEG